MFKTTNDFKRETLRLRSARKLHFVVEQEMARLLRSRFPSLFVISETTKVSVGHRADIVLNLKDGRRIHFEILASPSTVSNGIDSLDGSNADFCVAVILDEDVDKDVADRYYDQLSHKGISCPHWHTLKLSEILISAKRETFVECIGQIIREGSIRKKLPPNELRSPAQEWYVARDESEKEMTRVFGILRKGRAPDIFLTGDRGIGKSSFLNWIEEAALKRGFIVIKRRVIDEDWNQLVSELIGDTQKKSHTLPKYKSIKAMDMLVEAIRNLEENHKPVVLIIDQFERLFEKGEIRTTKTEMDRVWRSFENLTAHFKDAKRIIWVVAIRKQYYFLLFPRYGILEEHNFRYICLPAFSKNESKKLLTKVSNLTGYRLTEKAKKILVDNCGFSPQILILSFINLCNEVEHDSAIIDEKRLLKTRPWLDVFENDLKRLQTDVERLIVYAMSHARTEFCTFKSIMSKLATEFKASENELRDALRHLQNDLLLIKQPKQDVFEFYHPHLGDYITKKHETDFPEEWTADKLIEAALYLIRRLGTERADGMDSEIAADLFTEALLLSSEYVWAADKAIDLFVEQSVAQPTESLADFYNISMISVSEAEGLKKELGYLDASIFLMNVMEFYMSRTEGEPVETVTSRLRDKLLVTFEKRGLVGPWISQNIEYLCSGADTMISEFNDTNRAKRLVDVAVKLLNEEISKMKDSEYLDIPARYGNTMFSFGYEREAKQIYKHAYLRAKALELESEKEESLEEKARLLQIAAGEMYSIDKKEEAMNLLRRASRLLKKYLESIKSNRSMIKKASEIEWDIQQLTERLAKYRDDNIRRLH